MDKNSLNKISLHKLRPVDAISRIVTSKSDVRNTAGSVKCSFCDEFIASSKLRLHFRDHHPNARQESSIVCEKCGLQIQIAKHLRHLENCHGDKQLSES